MEGLRKTRGLFLLCPMLRLCRIRITQGQEEGAASRVWVSPCWGTLSYRGSTLGSRLLERE